jgi:hypothetical protein
MRIRHRSKRRRAVDAVGTYLKFDVVRKVAKRATKTVKGMPAFKATRGAAKKAPKPVKALPVVASVGVAGAVAGKRRHHDETEPAADAAASDGRQHEATPA